MKKLAKAADLVLFSSGVPVCPLQGAATRNFRAQPFRILVRGITMWLIARPYSPEVRLWKKLDRGASINLTVNSSFVDIPIVHAVYH